MSTASNAHVIDHPLVQHKLTLMRRSKTSTAAFRQLMQEVSMLLAYEVTRDFPVEPITVETPLGQASGVSLVGKKVVFVSVLRAGEGMLEGMLRLVPAARVGHLGFYRDPKTKLAVEYYFKLPGDMEDRDVIVIDPVLATGNSAAAAVERVKQTSPRSIKFVCIVTAPPGVANFHDHHPDVPIYTASLDETLDENGLVHPGLGDVGNRLFATK